MATATKPPVAAGQITLKIERAIRDFAEREGVTMSRAVGMLLAIATNSEPPPPDRRLKRKPAKGCQDLQDGQEQLLQTPRQL